MKLIICEKPNVARKMAYALNDSGQVKTFKKGKVQYFLITHKGEPAYVASAVGHLYTLTSKKGIPSSQYPVLDVEWRPVYEVDKSAKYTKPYVEVLKKLAKETDEYISACDYDIEGSLIAWNVIRFICKSKTGKRMKFSALTKRDLVAAYENMTDLDYNNSYAGEARHVLDWLYGINLSRGLMHAIARYGVYRPLSIGRVQGPALALLAEREQEIQRFKPTPYWELTTKVRRVKFNYSGGRFTDKKKAEEIYHACNGKTGVISSITSKKIRVSPNPPFDLTSLQVEAYRVFKFTPAQTLNLAQTLYEASMISYPRTSSQKLPAKLGHKRILQELAKHETYQDLATQLLEEGRLKPHEGKKDDPAHPAIHPLGPIAKVGKNEMKLYDLIVRRYLSCFGEPAEKERQTVVLCIGEHEFKASGTRVVKEGWMTYYAPYNKKDDKELPGFEEGETVKPKVVLEEKETQPPKRYTPASIVSELEKRGLGTKATRSVIIETLYKRGYIVGYKSIQVTEFGMAVYEALKEHTPDILDEQLTRHLEHEMEEIQFGRKDMNEVIEEGKRALVKLVDEFKKHEAEIGKELVKRFGTGEKVLGKCPVCGGNLVLRVSRKSKKQFVACSNYPKCTVSYPLYQNVKIEPTGKTCECGAPIVLVIRKGKRPFELCVNPNCPHKKNGSSQTKTDTTSDQE